MDEQQADNLKRTPLYDAHCRLSARMAPFAGWQMPIQYEGILTEYQYVRRMAAAFDISHMGEFVIEGDCIATGLDRIVTMPIANLAVNRCRYGMILNEEGGIIDDLIVFRTAHDEWFIVVNAANIEKDAAHFKRHLNPDAVFKDISPQTGKIDVQGPLSREILTNFIDEISKLDYYTFDYFNLLGEDVLVSRTGYTGELGFEIYFPAERLPELWEGLLSDQRLKPAGLGARDILRIEMGYSLYGHELSEDISPLQAGLEKFVDFSKEFIGKSALLDEKNSGVNKRIAGIISDTRRAPRQGSRIFSKEGEEIGLLSSGTFSPALQKGIGLGFIKHGHGSLGEEVYFSSRGADMNPAVVSARTFYKKGSLKE